MESDRFDLAIVGGGLSGSLLALAAGEAGLSTALIDRVPLTSFTDAGFDGRTTAIAYTSQRLFAALGVWPDLADLAEPILDIRISDAGPTVGRARCSCISTTTSGAAGGEPADRLDRREPLPARRGAAAAGGVPCRRADPRTR
jgi:2-polyprenyl-6-methoxyphenol hydroxylase-like FAD-dependent oxidoreductase